MTEYIVTEKFLREIPYAVFIDMDNEIIRCRDCKHSGDCGWSCKKWNDGEHDADVKPNGFCAWAERDV